MPQSTLRARFAVLLALLCVGAAGCAASGAPPAEQPATAPAGSPPAIEASGSTIAATLDERGLTTMARLVRAAGLEARLSGPGPYTLVAPTDTAFDVAPPLRLERISARRDRAEAFVLDHLLAGRVPPEALSDGLQTLTMYAPEGLREAGHRLTWAVGAGALGVDGARVTVVLETANGVVYVVDRLLPPAPEAWARPAQASPGERVTVLCRWLDADGTPVGGARCMFGWHFGDWMPHDETVTDAHGVARCTRVVPSHPGTDRVLVTVTARGALPTRTVVAVFDVR